MSLISNILNSFKREIHEIAHNWLYLSILVILPIVTLLFYAIIFSDGTIEKLPIAIVNEDKSATSHRIVKMLNATRGIEVVGYVQSARDAERMMRSGDIYGFMVIPNYIERNIYSNTQTTIELFLSGANISASGIIERDAQQVVLTMAAEISMSKLISNGISYNEAMVEISPINVQTHIISNPYLNYGYYLAPIFMFMAIIIFTVLATIYAIGRELRYSTAKEWLASSNNSIWGAVVGKLLPTTIIMAIHIQLINALLFIYMGMRCEGSYLILTLSSVLFIIAYQSVAMLIISLTSNLRLALSLGGGYTVMAFTFSGITFPTIAMFSVARVLSTLFPLSYFSDIFINEAMRGAPFEYSIKEVLAMALFLLLVPIATRRLSVISNNSNYWGKD